MENFSYFRSFLWVLATFGAGILLKPVILIIRDYGVWKLAALYVKRSKFHHRARRYAETLASLEELTNKANEDNTAQSLKSALSNIPRLDEERQELGYRLNMEIGIAGSIFKHYDQETGNPLREELQKAKVKAFRKKGLPYS